VANAWYTNGLKHFGLGDIVWKAAGGSSVKATLVDVTDYTFNASHEYMNTNTVPAASKVAVSGALTKVDAATGGLLDASDVTFSAVGAGDAADAIIVWMDGGGGGTGAASTTDFLICYIDTVTSGLPVTPNGGDITIQWGAQIATL
jgi:hypothetical protein